MKNQSFAVLLGTTTLLMPTASVAININQTSDAQALAGALFLNVDGVSLQDVLFSQEISNQAGLYQNPQGTYGLPPSGIVLSTGNVLDYGTDSAPGPDDGPDFEPELTVQNEGPATFNTASVIAVAALETNREDQIDRLSAITGQAFFNDIVELSVEFIAQSSQATFFATFGSEEFPDFVDSEFNDGFGLFVNGLNYAAVQPSTGGAPLPVNISHPDFESNNETELNGVLAPGGNPVLQFDVPLNVGEVNTFSVLLADASDSALSTTVYLSSFFTDSVFDTPGASQFNPILPIEIPVQPGDPFVLNVDLEDFDEGQTIWLDPPVAVGYTYTSDGPAFTSVTAPSLATVGDTDGYTIAFTDGLGGSQSIAIAAGEFLDLAAFGDVLSFELSGIDPDLDLDPLDPLAFPLGVTFAGTSGSFDVTITPTTVDIAPVPLPAGALLYLGAFGLAGAFGLRRKRTT